MNTLIPGIWRIVVDYSCDKSMDYLTLPVLNKVCNFLEKNKSPVRMSFEQVMRVFNDMLYSHDDKTILKGILVHDELRRINDKGILCHYKQYFMQFAEFMKLQVSFIMATAPRHFFKLYSKNDCGGIEKRYLPNLCNTFHYDGGCPLRDIEKIHSYVSIRSDNPYNVLIFANKNFIMHTRTKVKNNLRMIQRRLDVRYLETSKTSLHFYKEKKWIGTGMVSRAIKIRKSLHVNVDISTQVCLLVEDIKEVVDTGFKKEMRKSVMERLNKQMGSPIATLTVRLIREMSMRNT